MRLNKILLAFVPIFTLACVLSNVPQQTIPTVTPTKTRTVILLPTPATTPTSSSAYPQATPVPAWVTDFADPILEALVNRKPDFQDDFSIYRGWFIRLSGVDGYTYAERYDEMLLLRLPEKIKDAITFNPRINRTNFVLTLELRFNHDQPDDTVRFQFDGSPDQSIAFNLSNNRNWRLQWGTQDNWQFMADVYPHFPPEHTPVTIIMQGTQCAFYLNNDPLVYLNNCRTDPNIKLQAWVASFRLLKDTDHDVVVNFDNLKLWDLDKIPGLP